MQTKIGEVNSIKDLFKDSKKEEDKQTLNNPEHLKRYFEEAICKICGEKIKGLSYNGAISSGEELINNKFEKHTQLHILIKTLNI